jgi:hypothetical protein
MELRPLLSIAAALLLGGTLGAVVHAGRRDSAATQAARAFLATLGPEKARKAHYDFESEERFNWHFIPKPRNGISFKEMTPDQRQAALTLLNVGVSTDGMKRLETVRQLENVLHEMEQGKGPVRDPDLYFVTVFGEPSDKGHWGWRYEGHHVSLQWTMSNGQIRADTPQFLGANPAEVREGPMKGTRVLAQEEDLAYELLATLKDTQRKEAIVQDVAPSEIITGNSRRAAIQEDRGVAYAELSPSQKKVLIKLIEQHASLQTSDLARQRMVALKAAGLDSIKFAWMGGTQKGQGHYYRIQGKTFLIEFDNTQNDANHIHTVWRDFAGDFGVDLLAEHYRAYPHFATTAR